MSRVRRIASSFWFKITLSGGLLALLFRRADLDHVARVVSQAHIGWLGAALAAYLFSQALSALRWCVLARPLGFREPFSRYLSYYLRGMFLNLFVPSTVAGDVSRALLLAGATKRRALALTSVIADRGIGFIALACIGAAATLVFTSYRLPAMLYWAAAIAPILSAAVWWWGPLLMVRLLPPRNRWRLLVERDLEPYRRDRRLLLASFALAGIFHVVQIVSQLWIAHALALPVPWTYFFVFVPVVNIAGMLPISLNGLGVREAGYWYFLALAGIGGEPAIALGLIASAIVVVAGLVGAPLFLWHARR